MIKQIIDILLPLIIGGVVSGLVVYVRTERKKKEGFEAAVQALLKIELNNEWHRLTEQGFMYLYEVDIIDSLFLQYTALGGNHGMVLLVKDLAQLPRKTNKVMD